MPITRFIGALLRGLCMVVGLMLIGVAFVGLVFPAFILLDLGTQRPPLESVREVLGGGFRNLFNKGNTTDR